jgi:hypothetical protein
MRSATSSAQVDQCPAGKPAQVYKTGQEYFLQRGQNLCLRFIPSRVWVFCVDALLRVNQTGVYFFQAVGFLSDVLDLIDSDVTALCGATEIGFCPPNCAALG